MKLSDQLEAAMKAGTQGEWEAARRTATTAAIYSRILGRRVAYLAYGSTRERNDRVEHDVSQIVLLHNNLPTIIEALREKGL